MIDLIRCKNVRVGVTFCLFICPNDSLDEAQFPPHSSKKNFARKGGGSEGVKENGRGVAILYRVLTSSSGPPFNGIFPIVC